MIPLLACSVPDLKLNCSVIEAYCLRKKCSCKRKYVSLQISHSSETTPTVSSLPLIQNLKELNYLANLNFWDHYSSKRLWKHYMNSCFMKGLVSCQNIMLMHTELIYNTYICLMKANNLSFTLAHFNINCWFVQNWQLQREVWMVSTQMPENVLTAPRQQLQQVKTYSYDILCKLRQLTKIFFNVTYIQAVFPNLLVLKLEAHQGNLDSSEGLGAPQMTWGGCSPPSGKLWKRNILIKPFLALKIYTQHRIIKPLP
jgi:hypothetical protein